MRNARTHWIWFRPTPQMTKQARRPGHQLYKLFGNPKPTTNARWWKLSLLRLKWLQPHEVTLPRGAGLRTHRGAIGHPRLKVPGIWRHCPEERDRINLEMGRHEGVQKEALMHWARTQMRECWLASQNQVQKMFRILVLPAIQTMALLSFPATKQLYRKTRSF